MTKEEIALLTFDFEDYFDTVTPQRRRPCIYCRRQTKNCVWGLIRNPPILRSVKYFDNDHSSSGSVCNKECMDNFIYENQTKIVERILDVQL